ncbi:phosphoadenosine phosphosulfate reductase family protein [Marinactinospora rubrisoli]|uniref:Phosphoadenosine phosphosulfate reductase family protein n=1 Tax=Marinactinospora rubrisoli TaxID=2715399 RepID=A0ABW2KQX9_9ACTN
MTGTTTPDLATYDVVVVNSSAGKDSQAMLDYVAELARAADVMDRVTVVHNDLGETDSGLSVEWPGTADLARKQAEHYGFPLVVTRREKGGLFQQLREERKRFPSSAARWCTSDQKTSQGMRAVTGLCAAWRAERGLRPAEGRPVEVLYCLGIRAEESTARSLKPALEPGAPGSSGRRRITRWMPIHAWSEEDVWARIRESGVPYHPAYDAGMTRLSCSLCVLASRDDLVRACRLRPDLAREYADLEVEIGHRFRADISIADLVKQTTTA